LSFAIIDPQNLTRITGFNHRTDGTTGTEVERLKDAVTILGTLVN